MVKVRMRQQYAVNIAELTIGWTITELLPETWYLHIAAVDALKKRQQAHRQMVKQAGTAARLQIFLIEKLVFL
jgi:hypothetical protein